MESSEDKISCLIEHIDALKDQIISITTGNAPFVGPAISDARQINTSVSNSIINVQNINKVNNSNKFNHSFNNSNNFIVQNFDECHRDVSVQDAARLIDLNVSLDLVGHVDPKRKEAAFAKSNKSICESLYGHLNYVNAPLRAVNMRINKMMYIKNNLWSEDLDGSKITEIMRNRVNDVYRRVIAYNEEKLQKGIGNSNDINRNKLTDQNIKYNENGKGNRTFIAFIKEALNDYSKKTKKKKAIKNTFKKSMSKIDEKIKENKIKKIKDKKNTDEIEKDKYFLEKSKLRNKKEIEIKDVEKKDIDKEDIDNEVVEEKEKEEEKTKEEIKKYFLNMLEKTFVEDYEEDGNEYYENVIINPVFKRIDKYYFFKKMKFLKDVNPFRIDQFNSKRKLEQIEEISNVAASAFIDKIKQGGFGKEIKKEYDTLKTIDIDDIYFNNKSIFYKALKKTNENNHLLIDKSKIDQKNE